MADQERIFLSSEGDRWYNRNKSLFDDRTSIELRAPSILAEMYGLYPGSILEVGCSNGWRLDEFRRKYGAKCFGVEPSDEALKNGREIFPEITLERGVVAQIPFKEPCDLVVVNYVMHWVSRGELYRSIMEIDRLVKDGGHLILGDFLPDIPCKTRYHHYTDETVYTYKMDYSALFTASVTYKEIARLCSDHGTKKFTPNATSSRRGTCVLLKKFKEDFYPEVEIK
ncbi:MAG: class I SAM-dependent methyltransferase [Patescibacteria group bacterium]